MPSHYTMALSWPSKNSKQGLGDWSLQRKIFSWFGASCRKARKQRRRWSLSLHKSKLTRCLGVWTGDKSWLHLLNVRLENHFHRFESFLRNGNDPMGWRSLFSFFSIGLLVDPCGPQTTIVNSPRASCSFLSSASRSVLLCLLRTPRALMTNLLARAAEVSGRSFAGWRNSGEKKE